jgi:uncharacterized protein YbaP (TraB family)
MTGPGTLSRSAGCSRFARFAGAAATIAALLQVAPVQAQRTRNFIWKVTGPAGAVYLVGSVHLLTKDYYPLSPALDAAFKDSDLLVEEADLGEMEAPASQLKLLTRGMLPADQSLDRVLSAATYALVTKRVSDLGMPIEPLKRFKPWMLALTLVSLEWQKAGFDSTLGLDRHFYDRATVDGKTVQGLETVDYQLSLFDQMTNQEQDRMLAESIKNIDKEQAGVLALTTAWQAGDVATVERIVLDDVKDDPVMYERLLVNRNRNWLPKLDALLTRNGRTFVVVGAAHLVGPDGLLAMFKAKGYKVEQL